MITKELLKEKFGTIASARKAYKEAHGVIDDSWENFTAKVQGLPIPSDNSVISEGLSTSESLEEIIVTKELLKEKFGNIDSARKAYKKAHGVIDDIWGNLTAKVQGFPISSFPLSLKERVQLLEERVRELEAEVKSLNERLPREPEQAVQKITSYEEFKQVIMETYERINYEYNHAGFVPIYAIRRDIGERVNRSQFSEWMFQIMREGILSFYVCQDSPTTEDQLRDSIQDSSVNKLYFFCKKKENKLTNF